MSEHWIPFGRHRGQAPRDVPTGYLAWFLRECKPSSGLRACITDVLRSRGVEAPSATPPVPKPPPTCRRCGGRELTVSWHEIRGAARRVRGDCKRCGRLVGFLAHSAANIAAADAAQPTAPLLDVLTRAEDEGVTLVVRGEEIMAEPWQRASPRLLQLVRQSQHQLLRRLGRQSAARA
jgi:uncharacterized protein (DUF3820 family)